MLLVAAAVQTGPTHLVAAVAGIDGSGVLALAYLTVLATVLGFGTWSMLMGRYPASLVAPFTMLVPPVGLVTAWLALGERVPALSLAGSVLVVGGLLVPQAGPLRSRLARRRPGEAVAAREPRPVRRARTRLGSGDAFHRSP